MAERTCSVEDCDAPVKARGLCAKHYQYARTRGIWKDGIPCKGCGQPVRRTPGRTSAYCSPSCRPGCSVPGCDRPHAAKGLCASHHERNERCGDPLAPFERTSNKGLLCDFAGCDRPRRKRIWCGVHYGQWRRTGQLTPITRTWATDFVCIVCGKATGKAPGWRKFCGPNCAQLWFKHKGNVPVFVPCVACGKDIDLRLGPNGKRKRSETKLCRRCKMDSRKHGMSVEQLAVRDGTECGICGNGVDMSLRRPDLMCPSVDHIIPRARGGTNDPKNLQLAHYLCNARKSCKVDVLIE